MKANRYLLDTNICVFLLRDKYLVKDFCKSFEIIPLYESLEEYAVRKAALRRDGALIDDFDLLIGCTAWYHGLTLVTYNLRHFERLNIKIENWVKR